MLKGTMDNEKISFLLVNVPNDIAPKLISHRWATVFDGRMGSYTNEITGP